MPAIAPITPITYFAWPALSNAAPALVITYGNINIFLALLQHVTAELIAVQVLGNITDAQVQSNLDRSREVSPEVIVPTILSKDSNNIYRDTINNNINKLS